MTAPAPWFYLDADGFFASCEEAADPALHGRPVGVVVDRPYADAPSSRSTPPRSAPGFARAIVSLRHAFAAPASPFDRSASSATSGSTTAWSRPSAASFPSRRCIRLTSSPPSCRPATIRARSSSASSALSPMRLPSGCRSRWASRRAPGSRRPPPRRTSRPPRSCGLKPICLRSTPIWSSRICPAPVRGSARGSAPRVSPPHPHVPQLGIDVNLKQTLVRWLTSHVMASLLSHCVAGLGKCGHLPRRTLCLHQHDSTLLASV